MVHPTIDQDLTPGGTLSPFFKRNLIGRRATFWYWRLLDMVISLFKWEGLPDTVDRDYLEKVLAGCGFIVWTRDPNDDLRALRGSAAGFNCYNYPTWTEIANPVLPTFKRTFNLDAILMRNNKFMLPTIPTIREFAYSIAQIDVNMKINLDNLKTTTVFHAKSPQQAKQIKALYEKILNGEPAVITDSEEFSWTSEGKTEVFNPTIPYQVTQLLSDRRTIINDFLTQFGINNVALEKRERLITGEVTGNDQELKIFRDYWLAPRKEAVEKINVMFDTSISVDLVAPDLDPVENPVKGVEGGNEE